jgi:hypothetical protein
MSYKIIKFLWYFNKAFIYVLGLIFVGFNWSDYRLFTEIKLIYDSLILWGMNFFPKNPVAYDLKNKVEKDIKEILVKDLELTRKNKGSVVTDYRPYHFSDNLENVQRVKKSVNHTYISDGYNDWTISELLKDPYLITCVVILIVASGTIIVYKYDIEVMEWTQWSWTHIKSGFFAILAFIWKLIQWFRNGGPGNRPGNPPMGPEDIIPSDRLNAYPEIKLPGEGNVDSTKIFKTKYSIREALNLVESGIDKNHPGYVAVNDTIKPHVDRINLEIARIEKLPVSEENYINLGDLFASLANLKNKLPMKPGFANPLKGTVQLDIQMMKAEMSNNSTPRASTSLLADEIPLIKGFSIPKEPIIPFVNSPLPMLAKELEVSAALGVDNMTSYHGLTLNEMNDTLDNFVKTGLHSLDDLKAYLTERINCFDDENDSFRSLYSNKTDEIKLLQEEMQRLMELPIDESVLSARKDGLMRFEQIYLDLPHKKDMGLIEAVDIFNMKTYPEVFNDSNQPLYDIGAMERYTDQLDNNLNESILAFEEAKNQYGDEVNDIYNEIERLNHLPINSVTNKALYEMYLKLIDCLHKYPAEDSIDLIHKSPFIQPKTSELLSLENISEL